MKNFQLPSLPASCFGLAVSGKFDFYCPDNYEKVLWFSDETSTEVPQELLKSSADTIHPVVCDFPPGSPERIAALAEFYAETDPVAMVGESAFEITDDEIANRLGHTFDKIVKSMGETSLSRNPAKQELRRERRRLSE